MDFIKAFLVGVRDCLLSSCQTIKLLQRDANIRSKMAQCFLLNGAVFMCSLVLFEKIIVPLVLFMTPTETSDWLNMTLTTLFRVLWVLPLYLISRLLNVFWYQEIADLVYKSTNKSKPRSLAPTISQTIADIIYSVIVQCVFLIQASVIGIIPVAGHVLQNVHLSIVYSLYAFEYVWMNQGLGVVKRVAIMHANWAYFTGYGILMSVIISVSSSYFMGVCLFSLLFPMLIVSSHFTVPQNEIKHTSLPLFKPSVIVTDALMRLMKRR